MRRGEILALKWKNVDLDNGVIYVEESLIRSNTKGLVVKETKTAHSRREVFLSQSVIHALIEHKKQQEENKQDLVVASQVGGYLEPRNLIRKYKA